jgi:hypothetical protein
MARQIVQGSYANIHNDVYEPDREQTQLIEEFDPESPPGKRVLSPSPLHAPTLALLILAVLYFPPYCHCHILTHFFFRMSEAIIGIQITIQWAGNKWYAGTVREYKHETGEWLIQYDDNHRRCVLPN